MSHTRCFGGECMHDLPRSAVLFLSTGRPGERDDGQWDHATLSQLRVSADIYPGGFVEYVRIFEVGIPWRRRVVGTTSPVEACRTLVGLLPISCEPALNSSCQANSRISLKGRSISMSNEYRGTVEEWVTMVRFGIDIRGARCV